MIENEIRFIIFLLIFPLTVYAFEDTEQYRQCFDSNEKKHQRPCLVSYGTSIYGTYLELSFSNRTYRIKQSAKCNRGGCGFEMGENLDNLTGVHMYFLSSELNKVDKKSKVKTWTCFKKIHSKHRVCFKSI